MTGILESPIQIERYNLNSVLSMTVIHIGAFRSRVFDGLAEERELTLCQKRSGHIVNGIEAW